MSFESSTRQEGKLEISKTTPEGSFAILGLRVDLLDLDKLIDVVEGHHFDSVSLGILNVAGRLAWMGVDDMLWVDAVGEDLLHFSATGTIEASTKRGERLANGKVVVALQGIERLNPRERAKPCAVLAVDVSKINYDKRIEFLGAGCKRAKELLVRFLVSAGRWDSFQVQRISHWSTTHSTSTNKN